MNPAGCLSLSLRSWFAFMSHVERIWKFLKVDQVEQDNLPTYWSMSFNCGAHVSQTLTKDLYEIQKAFFSNCRKIGFMKSFTCRTIVWPLFVLFHCLLGGATFLLACKEKKWNATVGGRRLPLGTGSLMQHAKKAFKEKTVQARSGRV